VTTNEAKDHAVVRTARSLNDRFLDIPWGILTFLLLAVGGLAWTAFSTELKPSDYLTAVSGGAGLLAVGHGIREHGKKTDGRNSSSPPADRPSATASSGQIPSDK
jgi:hypothetical protein